MSSFPAAYAGRCGNCNEPFGPGEMVEYESDGALVIQDCCGTADAPPPVRTATTPADRVMPRGMKAADSCGTCFQVPASNGTCGCS